MALRVLLADESTTIKKVMQLALQDYGVDVKSVPVGLDVVPVSKSFKPDIIFIDVLLQKKSGYEVARDVKLDPALRETPVVLMWSGFMELDEAKVAESQVNGRLEKPFDADTLRTLIKDLVPRTTESRVSSYLSFPKLPDFDEAPAEEVAPSHAAPPPAAPSPAAPPRSELPSMPQLESTPLPEITAGPADDIFAIPEISEHEIFAMNAETDPDDQFRTVPLNLQKDPTTPSVPVGDEIWSHQDLSKFKIQVPTVDSELTTPTGSGTEFEKFLIPGEELNMAPVETTSGEFEEITFNAPTRNVPKAPPAGPANSANVQRPTAPQAPRTESVTQVSRPHPTEPSPLDDMPRANPRGVSTAMDQVLAEKILREEAHAVLEKVLWQILPGICERVVKEELNKLLKDVERSI